MDESSKIVTFKKPIEIEDLEISMDQERFQDTVPIEDQENWEVEAEKFQTPRVERKNSQLGAIKREKEELTDEIRNTFSVFQDQICAELKQQRDVFKQEIFCLHEQVNTIHSNVNMMDSAFHDRICDLNSELRGIKKMQQGTDGTSNQSPIQASKMRSDIQITSTPKVSLKPFSE